MGSKQSRDLRGTDLAAKTLTEKEMTELLKRIQNGDEAARETFVQGNLRLVLSVIQRFSNRKEPVDDLFQIGCIGLIKAMDNFDLSQNVRFSTTPSL